ncbi:MAG: hypothetical protein OEZ22_09480, partial [Spirochaetia bacterium]|nr:hypothetical protein [Spirochaetia bacterium]
MLAPPVFYILYKDKEPEKIYGDGTGAGFRCCQLEDSGYLEFTETITPGSYTIKVTDGEGVEFYSQPIIFVE